MFSAIKVDGQPLYKKARKGEKVAVKPWQVWIHELEFTQIDMPDVHFRVQCSKGTYVRSLAYDIGKAVNSGAYLTALCRTKIGDYSLDHAWQLEDLVNELAGLVPNPG